MKNSKQFIIAATAVACLLSAAVSHSHTRWNPDGELKPRQRADGSYPTDVKTGPCGDLPRSENPVELTAGSTITVEFQSNIYHQGFFRIAFSPADDQGFDENVLIDNIADDPNQPDRSLEITLPNVTCEACTLQLIQSMLDRSPPTNYFSCTDIRLVSADPVAPPLPDAPTNLNASQDGEQITLSWDSAASVVVFESDSSTAPEPQIGQAFAVGDTLDDATVVYVGEQSSTTLNTTPAGQTLNYFAFAYSEDLLYSAATDTAITLTAPSTPDPVEEEPVEEEPVESNQPDEGNGTGGALNFLFILGLLLLGPAKFLFKRK